MFGMVDTNNTPFARGVKKRLNPFPLFLQTATLPVNGVAATVSNNRMRKNKN
jgi:hypothetical protein